MAYRSDIDETAKTLSAKGCNLLDIDVFNDNTEAVRVYFYNAASGGSVTVGSSTAEWVLDVPGASDSPAFPGVIGKAWDAGLWFQKGLSIGAKTVAGGDVSSDIRINFRIR